MSHALQGTILCALHAGHRCRDVAGPLRMGARLFAARACRAQRRGRPVEAGRGFLMKELASVKREEEEEKDDAPTVTEIPDWEGPLTLDSILRYPDPRLRQQNAKIGVFDAKLARLASEMLEVMYMDDGVGLAAPQVGVNVRLMVFNPTGLRERRNSEVVLVNPRVVSGSKRMEMGEEGCLSFKDAQGLILGDVSRHASIKVRAQDLTGRPFVLDVRGWEARIFQHEYDHLQGVLLVDRVTQETFARQRDRYVGMEDAYAAAHPGVEIRRTERKGA